MSFDASRVCRICLEEGALSSVFSGNFTMSLGEMIELCANVKITKDDGMPERICNNCIHKLSVAYHFKQQCESSDLRLRQYLGLSLQTRSKDVAVMTDQMLNQVPSNKASLNCKCKPQTAKKKARYIPKAPSEKLKRGPKPKQKEDHLCYECNKQFKCHAQLEMHLRTHTGDRPYACMYCQRRFTQKYNMDIHMRVHTGEKPYQCEICSKRFTAQGNLRTHLKIHLGQRDHVCAICNKGFITSSELTRHLNKHRGARNFQCDMCVAKFTLNRDLKAHKQKVHKIESETINASSAPYGSAHIELESIENHEVNRKHNCSLCAEKFIHTSLLLHHCAIKHPRL